MASKPIFFLPILLLLFVSPSSTVKASSNDVVRMISTTLSQKGYQAMSLTIDHTTFNHLLTSQLDKNTTLTLFSPQDKAFFSSKHSQPPLTLLQYHITPSKLNSESNLTRGSKIETLVRGYPLVVTTFMRNRFVSLNAVKVVEWYLYDYGHVVVHGVEGFFDPDYVKMDNSTDIDGGFGCESESRNSLLVQLCLVAAALGVFVGAVLWLGKCDMFSTEDYVYLQE